MYLLLDSRIWLIFTQHDIISFYPRNTQYNWRFTKPGHEHLRLPSIYSLKQRNQLISWIYMCLLVKYLAWKNVIEFFISLQTLTYIPGLTAIELLTAITLYYCVPDLKEWYANFIASIQTWNTFSRIYSYRTICTMYIIIQLTPNILFSNSSVTFIWRGTSPDTNHWN